MAVAMKGLLKGLRYISHIFEEGNEPEMQIGVPTDVRHVAHIGWDGPTASPPSWMDQFKGDGEPVSPSPEQDTIQVGSESVDESPSRHRSSKGSRGGDSQAQPGKQSSRKKKVKGSSRSSSKMKSAKGREAETNPDPDHEGG